MGFPEGTSGKELNSQCRKHNRLGFDPWAGRIPCPGRAWRLHSSIVPGELTDAAAYLGYSPRGHKQLDTI